MLVADQLELEISAENLHLADAIAIGNVQLYTLGRFNIAEYVIRADGAIYSTDAQEITFQGQITVTKNGKKLEETDATGLHDRLPLDGSYFFPRSSNEQGQGKCFSSVVPISHAA